MQNRTIAPSLRDLTDRAKSLLLEYERVARELSEKFDQALDCAWRFGCTLNEIKETVSYGNWTIWLQNNLPEISVRHAQRHMELDASNPGAESIADLSEESVRKFRWGFVPQKERPQLEGDVTFTRTAHHLTIVNDWRKWRRRVEIGQAQLDQEEVRRDLQPVFEWMCELYGVQKP